MADSPDEVGRSRTRGYWDETYRGKGRLWGDEASPQALRALEVFRARGAGLVLDVGCGYGRDLALFEAAGLVAVGVDLSAEGLRMAREALLARDPVAHLVQADAAHLPFPDGTFEGVLSGSLLQLLAPGSAAAAAYEMHRVLAPGGVVVVAAFSTSDAECGKGKHLGANTYQQRGRTTRYFTGHELAGLFPGYLRLTLEELIDRHGDHGGGGGEHEHKLWFLAATKPERV